MPYDPASSPELLTAYLETEYAVHAASPYVLRIGERSPELVADHQRHHVTCSAFITAWNPRSRRLTDVENAERQQLLIDALAARGLVFHLGLGRHPSNAWSESSVLVLGLGRDEAQRLAERFEQHALVWAGADGVPELVLLRSCMIDDGRASFDHLPRSNARLTGD